MAVIRDARIIAATTTVTNILSGSKFEFLARDSVVEIFAACDGDAGLTADQPVMDVSFGNVLEADGVAIPITTAKQGPDTDKHKLVSAVAQAGDRLQIKQTNNDGANLNVRTLVKITAL